MACMQPFHPGLVHNYQTLVAKVHGCLTEMNYAKLNSQDAAVIDYHIAIVTENLNKLLQQLAVSMKSSFAMVGSDAGARTKASLMDALDILQRYKAAYDHRCKEAIEAAKKLPVFDENSNWHEFWNRLKYYVDDSPLPAIEKFDILCNHLEGKAKALVEGLSFEGDSYIKAIELLSNWEH